MLLAAQTILGEAKCFMLMAWIASSGMIQVRSLAVRFDRFSMMLRQINVIQYRLVIGCRCKDEVKRLPFVLLNLAVVL
jgi:hypothetical protein